MTETDSEFMSSPKTTTLGFLQYRCWAWNHLPDLVYESRKETTSKWLSHSAASTVLGDSIKQVVSCETSLPQYHVFAEAHVSS